LENHFYRRVRGIFVVLSISAAFIGLGSQLLSGNPPWAVVLMLTGISYLLFEANFNSWSRKNLPGMMRLVGTVMVICTLIGLYLRPIQAHFVGKHSPPQDQALPVATREPASSPPEKDMKTQFMEAMTEYNKTNLGKSFTPIQIQQIIAVLGGRPSNSVETDEQLSNEAFGVYVVLRSQAAMWNSGHAQHEGATQELTGALVPDGHGGARHMNQDEIAAVRKRRDPMGAQKDDAARKQAQPVVDEMLGLIPKIISRLKPYEQSGAWQQSSSWQFKLWNKLRTNTYSYGDLQNGIAAFVDLQKKFASDRGFKAVN
jgi:hypothetical protein